MAQPPTDKPARGSFADLPDVPRATPGEDTGRRNLRAVADAVELATPAGGGDPFTQIGIAIAKELGGQLGGGGGGDGKPPSYAQRHPWIVRLATILGSGGAAVAVWLLATETRSKENHVRSVDNAAEIVKHEQRIEVVEDGQRVIKARIGDMSKSLETVAKGIEEFKRDKEKSLEDENKELKEQLWRERRRNR